MRQDLDFYDPWGEKDSRKMPEFLFTLFQRVDHSTAVRADTEAQNFSVCPRYWYVDAYGQCLDCQEEFCFSATEQRFWYEELFFYIASVPRRCAACRKMAATLNGLKARYGSMLSEAIDSQGLAPKIEVIGIVDELEFAGEVLSQSMIANRQRLRRQISKLEE